MNIQTSIAFDRYPDQGWRISDPNCSSLLNDIMSDHRTITILRNWKPVVDKLGRNIFNNKFTYLSKVETSLIGSNPWKNKNPLCSPPRGWELATTCHFPFPRFSLILQLIKSPWRSMGFGGVRASERIGGRRVWKHPFERRISTNRTEKPQPTVVPFRFVVVFVVCWQENWKLFSSLRISFDLGKNVSALQRRKSIARLVNWECEWE